MAQYDIYYIEERLKNIDEQIVRIVWNGGMESHDIIARDKYDQEYIALRVPVGELDARVERELRYLNPKRGYNPFAELRNMEVQKEGKEEKKIKEMAQDMADIMRKPLIRDAYGA